MADITITNQSKNNLTVTPQNKDLSLTWDEATMSWTDSLPMTWDTQGLHIIPQAKINITITNQSKN